MKLLFFLPTALLACLALVSAESATKAKTHSYAPLSPFACHPSSFRCVQEAIWGCEGSHHQRIIDCASLSCKRGHCTWKKDKGMEGRGKGATLLVDIPSCCGVDKFVLDVPEFADLENLAWNRAATGV